MLDRRLAFVMTALAFVCLGGWALAQSGSATTQHDLVAAKPPGGGCCDPDLEPGVGGNPFCFEGHTCCADGSWGCNNPDGSPSCAPGEVCDGCGSRGDACDSDEDCCSGFCKGNGTCK